MLTAEQARIAKHKLVKEKKDTIKIVAFAGNFFKSIRGQFFLGLFKNHVGARHFQKPLGRRNGFNISITVGFTKFLYKSCQNISSTVGMTKSGVFAHKSCQNISTSVGMTKSRALLTNVVKIFLLL